MTRSVWLNREHERAHARDDATVVFPCRFAVGSVLPGAFAAGSFERLFRENYPAIRELLNRHREAGLALVVVRKDGLEASAWLAAKEGEINPCIIGRHSSADVFLPSDPSLSLRHLAVILYRREEERPVRFRVLDLRTATAFADEEGNRLEAVEAQGPLMLQCASFAILLFPSGGSNEPWPEDPDVAWRRIPERVYLERECADPARWLAPGGGARRAVPQAIEAGDRNRTLVDSFPGPIFVPWVLEGSGRARGEIVVSSSAGRVSAFERERRAARGPARQVRAVRHGGPPRSVQLGVVTGSPADDRARWSPLCGGYRQQERLVAGGGFGTCGQSRARVAPDAREARNRGVALLPLSGPVATTATAGCDLEWVPGGHGVAGAV